MRNVRPATVSLLLAMLALWSAGCSSQPPTQVAPGEELTLQRAASSFTIANYPSGGGQR